MNPLLSEAEQAARANARTAALALFDGGAPVEVTAESVGKVVSSVLEASDVGHELALVLVVEETARVNASAGAVVANAATAALLARRAGELVDGLAVACDGAELSADADGLSGTSSPAAGAMLADRFVAVTDDGVWLADSAERSALDLDGLRGAHMGSVTPTGAVRVGDGAAAASARELLRLQQAAVAVGICAAAQDLALAAIAAGKEAGGRPDRSQAVQWDLADIVTEGEAARVAVWHAACDDATDHAAAMALVLAADGAVGAVRRATQICGLDGLGANSVGAALQRDAKLMELLGGGTAAQLAEIADALLPDVPRA